ncbi:MAG: hypothetical protein MZV49_05025 [Rhodopseudomonas palustris]|nr:hypothetical protein [Rhodopseudomonas palustris]
MTDLPDPDSPTIPVVQPFFKDKTDVIDSGYSFSFHAESDGKIADFKNFRLHNIAVGSDQR